MVGESKATNVQVNEFFDRLRRYEDGGPSPDRRYALYDTIVKNPRKTRNTKNQSITQVPLSPSRDHLVEAQNCFQSPKVRQIKNAARDYQRNLDGRLAQPRYFKAKNYLTVDDSE